MKRLKLTLEIRKYSASLLFTERTVLYSSSVLVMPDEAEYKDSEYYKKHKTLSGDMYYQGRVARLGLRKREDDSLPEVREQYLT